MPEIATLSELTAAIAYRLPGGWDHASDPELEGTLHGPDGMCLVLSPSAFAGRVVKGVLPVEVSVSDLDLGFRSRCRIRVALANDADVLTHAIQARLLPVYVPLFQRLAASR